MNETLSSGQKLRVVIADDERPARSYLAALLRGYSDIEIVGEASSGKEAVKMIESLKPDLVLLDLQMPELDGLGVVRQISKDKLPLVAFVTAYDEFAVKAFELNAIDYLLKPVESRRLRDTINRAVDRLEHADFLENHANQLKAAVKDYEIQKSQDRACYLERIPIKQREEIFIVPVEQVASIIADGEILQLTTIDNRRFSFSHRLKDLELRLDPAKFVRLGRGTLANITQITRVSPLPGGTYVVTLKNAQQLNVSRIQAKVLRDQMLKL
ncbi:MAG: response regulator [Acidobacteria bacterium]|nr:response regulator [Acidobacteriota bacterium]